MKVSFSRKRVQNIIFTILVLSFMVFGILVSFNSKNLANRINIKTMPVFILTFVVWLLHPIIRCSLKSTIKTIYYVFCFSCVVSAIIRFDMTMLVSSLLAILIMFFITRSLQYIEYESLYMMVCIGTVVASVVIINHFGIAVFNSQGVIYAFTGVVLLNMICLKKIESIFPFAAIVLMMVLVLSITRSRTSLAGFLLVAIISYAYLFLKKISFKNVIIVFALFVIAIFLINNIETYFVEVFFHKWGNKDITSNRLFIWKTIFENISMCGHGVNHLNGGDAHNTLMQILGCDGIVCSVLFAILMLASVRGILRVNNKIVYINFFVSWLFISCFENLDFLTSRMLPVNTLFIFHLFLLMREQNDLNQREEYYG